MAGERFCARGKGKWVVMWRCSHSHLCARLTPEEPAHSRLMLITQKHTQMEGMDLKRTWSPAALTCLFSLSWSQFLMDLTHSSSAGQTCYQLSYFPVSIFLSPLSWTFPGVQQLSFFHCRLLYAQNTLSRTPSGTVAHVEGGQGPTCLMLRLKRDWVTAAKGRNRCASLRLN